MYHLLRGFHEYLTRRDEYSIVIIGLDNAGKTTTLERIKQIYDPSSSSSSDSLPTHRIVPTVGQNIGLVSLPGASTTLRFFDLGGQHSVRSIWSKYYDECHALVFVLDASDPARLQEGWEAFASVLSSERAAGLPLLLLANKRDVQGALTVEEIREGFEARERARDAAEAEAEVAASMQSSRSHSGAASSSALAAAAGTATKASADERQESDTKGKGPSSTQGTPSLGDKKDDDGRDDDRSRIGAGSLNAAAAGGNSGDGYSTAAGMFAERAERIASLDVLGISALTGDGVKQAVEWLHARVRTSRTIRDRS